ncbi:unnamed protein product [Moneuplotes crassus]|uniref:Uncharacterized protein n=1 Tax=Euplotes crassus TaxID=5936 RepID=A0AAD1XVB0_EUPCR|nr:unnamed protein product [Moneuplotes crassus]
MAQKRMITMQTKTLFHIPKMAVHSRGYNHTVGDISHYDSLDMSQYIIHAETCEELAYVFNKYPEELAHQHIANAFLKIGGYNYDRGDEFFEVILPRVKEQLKVYDRHCIRSVFKIIKGAAGMRLQDNEFWELVEEKLIDDRLFRYLTLDETCSLVDLLGLVQRGSDELIELCEKYIIKHRKSLIPKNIREAAKGFKKLNKGSAVLFEVLQDPTRGLKQINE